MLVYVSRFACCWPWIDRCTKAAQYLEVTLKIDDKQEGVRKEGKYSVEKETLPVPYIEIGLE
jgi:hypothetical protein